VISPSRSSKASRVPVEAPDGTAALVSNPASVVIDVAKVGLPRESSISIADTFDTLIPMVHLSFSRVFDEELSGPS
jgi:hypothetical protein